MKIKKKTIEIHDDNNGKYFEWRIKLVLFRFICGVGEYHSMHHTFSQISDNLYCRAGHTAINNK
jgi:hypothetical protein